MNILLNDEQREKYKEVIESLAALCPELTQRKIARANIQQAFIYKMFYDLVVLGDNEWENFLCVGCHEDTAYEALNGMDFKVHGIDPFSNGITLDAYFKLKDGKKLFNIIFSTSVIEHVEDDEQFIDQICKLLYPGGTAILTCDFKEGWKPGDDKPGEDYRLYTKHDLLGRLHKILIANNCGLVGDINYEGEPDFTYGIHKYSFATYVFRKDY